MAARFGHGAPSPADAAPRVRHIAKRPGPRRTFGVAIFVAVAALSVVLFILIPSAPLLARLLAVNLTALLTYGYDKTVSGGSWQRVPEAVLLGLALLCGSLGALVGMLLFRHKTRKPAFLTPSG